MLLEGFLKDFETLVIFGYIWGWCGIKWLDPRAQPFYSQVLPQEQPKPLVVKGIMGTEYVPPIGLELGRWTECPPPLETNFVEGRNTPIGAEFGRGRNTPPWNQNWQGTEYPPLASLMSGRDFIETDSKK